MHFVGIDIGGTTIKAGLVTEAGIVLDSRQAPTIIDNIDGLIESLTKLIRDLGSSDQIGAVGIGIPGLRSTQTHLIETSPNIPCIHHLNLEEILSKRLKMKVVTENDANAGAYGEWAAGKAKSLQHMAYITIGTGLGCGLILSGNLYRGASGYAGEMGHVNIEPDGRQCACGSIGCLETRVSAPGLVQTAREMIRDSHGHPGFAEWTAHSIYNAACAGDEAASKAFEWTGRFLGIACANLINLLNLEMIVVGGGVIASGDLLLDSARAEVQRRAFEPAARICPIVQSQLWPNAGLIGAAMLARDQH
jgi:glucokinase